MEAMMSRKLSILSMAAVTALAAAPRASAGDLVKVDVPFEFVLAGKPLPSGEYRFETDPASRLVRVTSKERGHVALTMCQLVPATSGAVGLLFHQHGGRRFLKAVTTGHTLQVALPTTRAEKEAAAADAAGRPVAALR
jgi:hypothetical protein